MEGLVDSLGNAIEPGDWYIHRNDIPIVVYERKFIKDPYARYWVVLANGETRLHSIVWTPTPRELKWCVKYPKELGLNYELIKKYRALLGWES